MELNILGFPDNICLHSVSPPQNIPRELLVLISSLDLSTYKKLKI